jgi:amidophosphoribosyltransferase
VLQNKRIIIVDDSIVRGTTSLKIVRALREAGAKEVHMRISSPPVTHPCFYGIDTDNQEQLIGATKSVEEIANR